MAVTNAQFTGCACGNQHLYQARINLGFGADDVTVNGHSHGLLLNRALKLGCLLHCLLDRANHVERLLRQMIIIARQQAFEASDGVLQRDVDTR